MVGLEKLSTLGFEGSGGRVGSLFLNGDKLPSENKKLVSRGSTRGTSTGSLDKGGKSFS